MKDLNALETEVEFVSFNSWQKKGAHETPHSSIFHIKYSAHLTLYATKMLRILRYNGQRLQISSG